jgi:hypothetical protein
VPLRLQIAAGQTANAFEVKNSAGATTTYVSSTGTELYVGANGNASGAVQIGHAPTGNQYAYVDLVGDTTYSDYGLRLIRTNGGPNTPSQLVHRGTGNMYFIASEAAYMNFQTSGTDRMVIDPSGRITTPAQPSFMANSTNSNTSGQDIIWNTTTQNVGSSYNTSTGKFTAPIAGFYYFHAHGLWNNASSGDMRIALYRNAAGFDGMRFISQKAANVWQTWVIDGVVYMSANDSASIRIEQATGGMHTDAGYNQFSGYLLG